MPSTAALLSAFASFFKAMPPDQIDALSDAISENVTRPGSDMWADPRAVDPRRLAVGPQQAASGGGASKMTSEYSSPSPQVGNQNAATRLGQLFDEIKSLLQVPGNQPAPSGYLGKANGHLASAKAAIMKCDIGTDEAAKSAALASAKDYLAKAAEALEDAASDPDEDQDDNDQKKGGLSKSIERFKFLTGKVAALESGTAAVSRGMSVEQLLATVAGRGAVQKSRQTSLTMPPDMSPIAKAAPSISARVDEAIDSGSLTEDEITLAMTLNQHMALVAAGKVDHSEFLKRASTAPFAVKSLFGLTMTPASYSFGG
jgi:hypothetical protein